MHPLEKKTLKIIRQEELLHAGEKVMAAVSAGPDSMTLLHILARLVPIINFTLTAAYVNHGLRPEEAQNEKLLVEHQARKLGVDFFSGTVDVKGFAAEQKLSLEHGARLLRFDYLEKTARLTGAQKIALAHTADDQAEEILLRLIRGTARKGLSGMKTIRDEKFIRPFLRFPKDYLLDYLEEYGIPFQIDSSNRENIFLRNRIRHDLLPYLAEKYNPDIRQTLIRTANILQDEEELLETICEAAFSETVTIIPGKAGMKADGSALASRFHAHELKLNLELFNSQPRAIQRRLLEKCCWLMACEPRSRQIEDLLQLAILDSPAGSLHFADGLRVERSWKQICFYYPRGRGPFRGKLLQEKAIELPDTNIPAPGSYDFPAVRKRLVVEYLEGFTAGADDGFSSGEYLDAGLFSFPLTLRSPQPGDRFQPLGAPGRKKVSTFLSEQKIAKNNRGRIPVLTADDIILALPGFRIDHRFRITGKTIQVIRIRWKEMG